MPYTSIQKGLESKLNTLSGLPDVAWENVAYNSLEGVPYIVATNNYVSNTLVTMGPNGMILYKGFMTLNLWFPANGGSGPINTLKDSIITLFKAGTSLIVDGLRLMLTESGLKGTSKNDGVWYQATIVVNWQVFV
jgi:hypothetical protein